VNFVDKTIVRLADPTTRAAVFDQVALEQIAACAYDADAMGLHGPYSAIFDEFALGLGPDRHGLVEGDWSALGSSDSTRAQFRVRGLGASDAPRVDALWQGSIVARFSRSQERIEEATSTWPSLGEIDAEIVAALGNLPANKTQLENQRKTRFVAHMQTTLDQPEAFDDTSLAAWLDDVGADSVGDLLTRFSGTIQPGTMTVTFSPPAPVVESPRALPLAALLLVRDAPVSLADLLAGTSAVRDRARALGIERPHDPELHPRSRVVVIWVVPATLFDDTDWPGANPAARRTMAGAWLAESGIGLAAL
jgi:hypothetical protein